MHSSKVSANITDTYLTDPINNHLSRCFFSENTKQRQLGQSIKKRSNNNINYRPISLLKALSNIYERFINDALLTH